MIPNPEYTGPWTGAMNLSVYIDITQCGKYISFLLNQPDTWDDDDDGIWKPRMIPNPEYKGPYKRKVLERT
jgi:hypothetical protein